jgi:hypothetical protein
MLASLTYFRDCHREGILTLNDHELVCDLGTRQKEEKGKGRFLKLLKVDPSSVVNGDLPYRMRAFFLIAKRSTCGARSHTNKSAAHQQQHTRHSLNVEMLKERLRGRVRSQNQKKEGEVIRSCTMGCNAMFCTGLPSFSPSVAWADGLLSSMQGRCSHREKEARGKERLQKEGFNNCPTSQGRTRPLAQPWLSSNPLLPNSTRYNHPTETRPLYTHTHMSQPPNHYPENQQHRLWFACRGKTKHPPSLAEDLVSQ